MISNLKCSETGGERPQKTEMPKRSCRQAIILALLAASPLFCQPQTQLVPDCFAAFTFNAAGSSQTFVNSAGCVSWTLVYNATGFTGLTLTFQDAPGTITPGSFVTYSGTVDTGVNPNTSTTGAVTTFSNGTVSTPYLRVALSGLTGTGIVQGVFYGWRTGSGGGGGGGGSGCPGTVMTPCITGAQNSSAAAVTDFTCDQSAPISISGSGLTQIVAASGSTQVRICHVNFSNSGTSNVTIEYGTGTNCGTGTTATSGAYQSVLAVALDFTPRDALTFPAGKAVCLNFASSVTSGGLVSYAQF